MAVGPAPQQDCLTGPRIVGVVLVHNEDVFVERAVRNAAPFCDHILLMDHGSTDATVPILKRLAKELPSAEFHRLSHPRESHELISGLAGQDTWIFAVDGDEIYDTAGLLRLRERITSGEFARTWMILGNVLNVTTLGADFRSASGHLAPPCRSMTKLYNFAAIDSWGGDAPERLHGGEVVFRPGFDNAARRMLHDEVPWEESDFRCLHMCFLSRSSRESGDAATRENIMEKYGNSWQRVIRFLRRLVGLPVTNWKDSRYRRGPEVTVSTTAFFPTES